MAEDRAQGAAAGGFRFTATQAMDEAFGEAGIDHQVVPVGAAEQVWVRVRIQLGMHVMVRFIVDGEDSGVKVRVYDLIAGVPDERHVTVLKACNALNSMATLLRFFLDQSNCVQMAYDFPQSATAGDVGLMAVEVLGETARMLEESYQLLVDAAGL